MFTAPISGPDPIFDDTFTIYPSSLTKDELVKVVVLERLDLFNNTKPCGAVAIRKRLHDLGGEKLPSISTIGRILSQQGLTYGRIGFYPEDRRRGCSVQKILKAITWPR
jgi:hypothetical protein